MLKKEIKNITHLSQYKKELKSVKGVSLTVFAPDSDNSFTIYDKAILFGKNTEDVITNINRHYDYNWYNSINASSGSLDIPEIIYAHLYFNKKHFIIKYILRCIDTLDYECQYNNIYHIVYESAEIYHVPHFRKEEYSNYYSIKEKINELILDELNL